MAQSITLQNAVAQHQAGRLDQAEAMYRQLLAAHPDHPDVLNLLGVLCVQKGDGAEGLDLMTRAADRNPNDPAIQANLGTALLEAGRTNDAIDRFRRALALSPDHLDALYNLGNTLLHNGAAADAVAQFERVIAQEPSFAPAHNNLALCRLKQGELEPAIASFRRAIAIDPAFVEAHNNLGQALQRSGQLDGARTHYKTALKLKPDDADAHNHIGTLFEMLERPEDARRHYETALGLAPDDPEIHLNVGNLLRTEGRLEDAAAAYRGALALQPDHPAAHNNLGNVLALLGDRESAISHLERALALRPDYAEALNNLAKVLRARGGLDDAIATYDRALAIAPDLGDARFGRAEVLLSLGRFSDGWRDYGARISMAGRDADHHRTPLDDDLAGRRILVERDQGLGDEIFFLRFLAALRGRGAHVAYLPDPRLAAMLRRAGIADEILDTGEPRPQFDMRISAGDLPHLLGHADSDPAPPSLHLPPLPEVDRTLRERLSGLGPPPYVGITWKAGTKGSDRALFKEVPRSALADTLKDTEATFVALQRAPEPGEVAAFGDALGATVHDLTALNDDLEAMLALMGAFDAYVCVSNTNVHLRAARGAGCHVLVPNPPEFRWMADGAVSPWFPDSRIYRQRTDGDWRPALVQLGHDLPRFLAGPGTTYA